MKAILVIDMPESCHECKRPSWCPLLPIPEDEAEQLANYLKEEAQNDQ